jgi:hypothetical protein
MITLEAQCLSRAVTRKGAYIYTMLTGDSVLKVYSRSDLMLDNGKTYTMPIRLASGPKGPPFVFAGQMEVQK